MSKLSKILLSFAGVSLAAFALARFILGGWMPIYTILIVLTVAFALTAVVKDRKVFFEFFTMKTTKHGLNMGAMILLVLLLTVILNYIGVKRNKTWDFSQAQTNTLSEQSIQVVKNLKSDLRVLYFYKEGTQGIEDNRRAFRELLKKYQDQSNKVSLEFFEVNQHPKLAEDYGVTKGSGLAFVEYEGRRNRLERVEEQEITQAIIKVTREKMKTLYFVTGHGEADIEDGQEASGLNALKLLIENNSFVVKTWNLPSAPQAPADADAVMIVGPRQAYQAYEIKAIEDYLKNGGRVLMALEPGKTQGLEQILKKVGVSPENNFIKSSFMGLGYIDGGTLGNVFSLNSPVTRVFSSQRDVVRMDWPMNLKTETVPANIKIEAIVKTDQNASAFKEPRLTNQPGPTGPFQLGLEISGKYEGGEKDFQMVVYGDAEFLANQMLYQNLNRDLALNTVSQLAREEGLISITPREIQRTELMVTTAKMGSFYVLLFLIPLGLLITAVTFWLRRRGG